MSFIELLTRFHDLRYLLVNKRTEILPLNTSHLAIAHLCNQQRWSPRGRPWPRGRPRGHILKSLASKVKSLALALASKPQVLENCLVLGSRTALVFKQLKFCWKAPETSRKICEHFFCFPHLEHRRSQGEDGRGSAPFPIEISPMTKM